MDKNLSTVAVEWQGGLRFNGGAPDGPTVVLDGDGNAGPGPMAALLLAAASCSGIDMVMILEKARVQLRRCAMQVTGVRADDHPRRYVKIHFEITLAGDGLDEAKARRAIDLSIEKYCSVLQSLGSDIPVSYDLVLAP
jgi:putative redox protein